MKQPYKRATLKPARPWTPCCAYAKTQADKGDAEAAALLQDWK